MKIFKVIGLIVATLVSASAIAAEEITYYHTNLHGSPVAATDNAGAILWERSYDPWGHPTSSASVSPLGYTGAPREDATNLTDLKARWYSPVSGRMQSLDPVSFHEENIHSFNLYAYGNNNPYRYEDPDGEVAIGFLTETAPAAGESFAALAAYTVGYVRGDAFLMQVALDGMYERRSENISAIFAPIVPKAVRGIGSARKLKGLETRGYKSQPGERTIQGQVDAATRSGNVTVKRGGRDLFRLRPSGHGQPRATATPQNVRRVSPEGDVYVGRGPDRGITNRDMRELYKGQTGHGTSAVRTRSGRNK